MTLYLRRKRDGQLFGFNEHMAKNSDLEQVDLTPEQAAQGGDGGNALTEREITARQFGLTEDAMVGYPEKGETLNPLAPYGTNMPQREDAVDGKFGKDAAVAATAKKIEEKAQVKEAALNVGKKPSEPQEKSAEVDAQALHSDNVPVDQGLVDLFEDTVDPRSPPVASAQTREETQERDEQTRGRRAGVGRQAESYQTGGSHPRNQHLSETGTSVGTSPSTAEEDTLFAGTEEDTEGNGRRKKHR